MKTSSTSPRIQNTLDEFLASRFDAKNSLNVVLSFRSQIVIDNEVEACTQETVQKTLRLLQRKLNQYTFGNASRKKRAGSSKERTNVREIAFTAALHTHPHCHVHCQIEIPSESQQSDFSKFIREFANRNRWITSTNIYIEDTNSNIATQKYNSRYGTDTIILF